MKMHLCRKIFASYLRQSGIPAEVVNLLQGRVDSDILTRHYLVPSSTLNDQVLEAIEQIQKLIDGGIMLLFNRNISKLKRLLHLQKIKKERKETDDSL